MIDKTHPEKIFLTIWEEAASGLYNQIRNNKELGMFELAGLAEGKKRGKRPDVSLDVLYQALKKQWKDLEEAYMSSDEEWVTKTKKSLADLRNVAGILFIELSPSIKGK